MTIIKPANILDHFSKDYEYQKILAKKISPAKCDDLLQEAYIKLHNRFVVNNREFEHNNLTADRMYIYLTMSSINTDFYKSKKNKPHLELNEEIVPSLEENNDIEEKEVLERRLEDIKSLLDTLHWYDHKLFEIYLYSGKSIRTIAQETKISVTSIFNTIKDVKLLIKEKVQ